MQQPIKLNISGFDATKLPVGTILNTEQKPPKLSLPECKVGSFEEYMQKIAPTVGSAEVFIKDAYELIAMCYNGSQQLKEVLRSCLNVIGESINNYSVIEICGFFMNQFDGKFPKPTMEPQNVPFKLIPKEDTYFLVIELPKDVVNVNIYTENKGPNMPQVDVQQKYPPVVPSPLSKIPQQPQQLSSQYVHKQPTFVHQVANHQYPRQELNKPSFDIPKNLAPPAPVIDYDVLNYGYGEKPFEFKHKIAEVMGKNLMENVKNMFNRGNTTIRDVIKMITEEQTKYRLTSSGETLFDEYINGIKGVLEENINLFDSSDAQAQEKINCVKLCIDSWTSDSFLTFKL